MNNFNRQLFYKEKNYIPENEDIILKKFFEETSKKYDKSSSDEEDDNSNDENIKYEKITISSLKAFFEEKKKINRKIPNNYNYGPLNFNEIFVCLIQL